jgi:hypothetical protein
VRSPLEKWSIKDSWSLIPFAITALLIAVGFTSTMPVGPVDQTADATAFSSERAMEHVSAIAQDPHPLGSDEIGEVRNYLTSEIESLGLEVDLQRAQAPDAYGDRGTVEIVNIISWIPGAANTRAVAFVAHYDTHPATPGANDNSAAVAAMLETARALQAGPPLANDIIFLFTDAEEPNGRFGANAFAALPGVLDAIGLFANLEANGASGASTIVQTSGPQSWLINEFASNAPSPTAFSFLTDLTSLLGEIGTDFDVFDNAGIPGFNFAYMRESPIYHTDADSIGSVNQGSLQHHGTNILSIARRFGDLDLTEPGSGGDSVFFTVRPFFVRYSTTAALVLAGLVAVGFVIILRRREEQISLRRLLTTSGITIWSGLLAAVAGTIVCMLLTTMRPSLHLIEGYAYFAVVLAIAAVAARQLTSRRGAERTTGILFIWMVLAVITALALPGFSYLFGWPALIATVALVWAPRARSSALLRFTSVAVFTLLVMTPAVDYLLQFSHPRPGNTDSQITAAVLVPILLALLTIDLLTTGWHHRESEN